eukprot:symbB.v1.2.010267.t2/scaffold619.1/size180033/3
MAERRPRASKRLWLFGLLSLVAAYFAEGLLTFASSPAVKGSLRVARRAQGQPDLPDAGIAVIEKVDRKTQMKEQFEKEKWWRVLLHNDDIHTFEYVTNCLVKVVQHLSRRKAYNITWEDCTIELLSKAAVENLSFSDEKKEFIINALDPELEKLIWTTIANAPAKPLDFMIDFLRRQQDLSNAEHPKHMSLQETNVELKKQLGQMQDFMQDVGEIVAAKAPSCERQETQESEDEDEEDDDAPDEPPPPSVNMSRQRASVSAEAYGSWNQKKPFDPPQHAKTEEQSERLHRILSRSFMFSSLSEKDFGVVLLAMKEVSFLPGEQIIREGDDGDFLCLIEKGNPECKKMIDGEEKVVKQCAPGDIFGELALLYNAKRAASVYATDACVAWQYVELLEKVTVFFSLDDYQRVQVSDALKTHTFQKDEIVIQQGDEGQDFYIVEEGSLTALKQREGQLDEVMQYSAGSYFGELAMLKDEPRAATVKVTSDTAKVLSLDRRSFERLLGPLRDLLLKKAAEYSPTAQAKPLLLVFGRPWLSSSALSFSKMV